MRRSDLERLKEHVDGLDPAEQHQVFNIVQKYTKEFTTTTTGVLVPASGLSEECLQEMKTYVSFCQDQKRRMDADQVTRKKYERLATSK